MLHLHVLYTIKENKRDAFYKLINDLGIAQKSRDEEDNIKYDYYIPYDTENQIFLLEIWKTKEGFELHKKSEHFLELQSIKEEYIEHAKLDIFEIVWNIVS